GRVSVLIRGRLRLYQATGILEERGFPERTRPVARVDDLVAPVGDMSGRDVLGDQRTGADVGTWSDVDPAHDHRAPADERAVAHDRGRLFGHRVIPGDSWIKLAVDEVAGDTAARSDATVIVD